jgi:hypothetical protein
MFIFDEFVVDSVSRSTKTEILDDIRQQMSRFSILRSEAKTDTGQGKTSYTGKIGKSQDDLMMCILFGTYWGAAFEILTAAMYPGRQMTVPDMCRNRDTRDVDMSGAIEKLAM